MATTTASALSRPRTAGAFINRRACSETLFCALDRGFQHPNSRPSRTLEERGSLPLAGGIMARGYQCGALWGATLNAGAQIHRQCGAGARAEAQAIITAHRLVRSFRERNLSVNCAALTVPNIEHAGVKYFIFQGGFVRCMCRVANFAPAAYSVIENSLRDHTVAQVEDQASRPEQQSLGAAFPVSCTSLLARRLGASERHSVMAAGLAGGIGLCGGACGALGTAVWLLSMRALESGIKENLWESKPFRRRLDVLFETLQACTSGKIECSDIVGRTFLDVNDHAAHVQSDGCSEIIEMLTNACIDASAS